MLLLIRLVGLLSFDCLPKFPCVNERSWHVEIFAKTHVYHSTLNVKEDAQDRRVLRKVGEQSCMVYLRSNPRLGIYRKDPLTAFE